MAARTPIVLGSDGLFQQLQGADTLATGLRIERASGTVAGGAGGAAVTFALPTFKTVPVAFVEENWSGSQMICGKVTATTTTGCTVQVMISQGTLVLNAAPFTTAPNGSVVNVIVIGY